MTTPIRVFQVATGNVGSEMIKRLQTRPDLELVGGVHCYSPDKVGRDAGELAGIGPIGVTATGSIEEIIAAKPDVLTFHGVFPRRRSLREDPRSGGDQHRDDSRLDHRLASGYQSSPTPRVSRCPKCWPKRARRVGGRRSMAPA